MSSAGGRHAAHHMALAAKVTWRKRFVWPPDDPRNEGHLAIRFLRGSGCGGTPVRKTKPDFSPLEVRLDVLLREPVRRSLDAPRTRPARCPVASRGGGGRSVGSARR